MQVKLTTEQLDAIIVCMLYALDEQVVRTQDGIDKLNKLIDYLKSFRT